MLPRIAFLACAETLPGSPTRRPDAFEHDLQISALRHGLAGRADVTDILWDAPLDQLTGFDLAVLGTAWDYTDRPAEFLGRLEALEAMGVKVCNPADMVRWNADKGYLKVLADTGAASIPTLWHDDPGAADIIAAFDHFGTDRVVVKRRVGAGAVGQFSFTRAAPPAPDWRMGHPAMIQPFLPAIQHEGEYSLIFIDGLFSHALIKTAAAGDYRIQSLYGGRETPITPDSADLAIAQGVIAMLPFAAAPLYARIDMVRGLDGRLALIEAEMIEPYLYPEQGPQLGPKLAEAVLRRLRLG
jgi:glutathione synthase/RimK-type ligase-like ATP-grasp enzyme